MQGTIHRVIRGKGFGFIRTEERQYFFHHSEVQNAPFKRLAPGDIVEFQPHEESDGLNPRATEVLVVVKADRAPSRNAVGDASSGRPSRRPGRGRGPAPGNARTEEPLSPSSPGPSPRPQDPDDLEFVSGFGSSTEGEAPRRRRRKGPGRPSRGR